jgi:hypothetical protein
MLMLVDAFAKHHVMLDLLSCNVVDFFRLSLFSHLPSEWREYVDHISVLEAIQLPVSEDLRLPESLRCYIRDCRRLTLRKAQSDSFSSFQCRPFCRTGVKDKKQHEVAHSSPCVTSLRSSESPLWSTPCAPPAAPRKSSTSVAVKCLNVKPLDA